MFTTAENKIKKYNGAGVNFVLILPHIEYIIYKKCKQLYVISQKPVTFRRVLGRTGLVFSTLLLSLSA